MPLLDSFRSAEQNAAVSISLAEVVAGEVRAVMGRKRVRNVDLARGMEVSEPYISRRLSGEVALNLDDLEHIARILDVPVATFLPATRVAA